MLHTLVDFLCRVFGAPLDSVVVNGVLPTVLKVCPYIRIICMLLCMIANVSSVCSGFNVDFQCQNIMLQV